MYKPFLPISLICILLFPAWLDAQTLYGTEKGFISFHSDAPLELISAKCDEMRGRLDIEKKIFAFSVKINAFKGFNNPLQREHFNENYLESNQYPMQVSVVRSSRTSTLVWMAPIR